MFELNETLEQARVRNIRDALMEDIGVCDWTGQLVPVPHPVTARVLVREDAVLCGREWFDGSMQGVDPALQIEWHYAEGDRMLPDTAVCHIHGEARSILTASTPASISTIFGSIRVIMWIWPDWIAAVRAVLSLIDRISIS